MMYRGDWGPINSGPDWWFGQMPILAAMLAPIFIIVVLWSLVWKGLALWHSARRGQYWWFIAMMLINTLGILEIIYLFGFAKLKFNELFSTKSHNSHH